MAAIQIAKMFQCRVIATAGGDAKLAKARELGADHAIDHYRQDISAEVKRITGKRGVDVAVEHVGVATWPKSLESLAPGGRLAESAPVDGSASGAREYAAREAANPQLGQFEGGGHWIYVGGGSVVVILLVVLLVVLLI